LFNKWLIMSDEFSMIRHGRGMTTEYWENIASALYEFNHMPL